MGFFPCTAMQVDPIAAKMIYLQRTVLALSILTRKPPFSFCL